MHRFEIAINMLDETLDTRKKRHITGGVLLSVSILFAGLAFTVITIKTEENDEQQII